jgi:hypothetical protein
MFISGIISVKSITVFYLCDSSTNVAPGVLDLWWLNKNDFSPADCVEKRQI